MLNVVTVQVGNYCARGKPYLRNLFDGIRRGLHGCEFTSWCITDDPRTLPQNVVPIKASETGWWAKLEMFRPRLFPKGQRVLYFDLDTVICGDLYDFANYVGPLAVIKDFYEPWDSVLSAVMNWEAGKYDHIWGDWEHEGRPKECRGDQDWIEKVEPNVRYWQDICPNQLVSFKVHCQPTGGIPFSANIIAFHGRPRPHEVMEKWAKELWKE